MDDEDYICGVKVKLRPNEEQSALFDQNFGCCRKARNEVLARYMERHDGDCSKVPTQSELNNILNEVKKDFPYIDEVESTSIQQAVYDLQPAFRNNLKSKRHNPPKFHTKKKTECSFRQTIRKEKRPVNGKVLTLRVYGDLEFRTSSEHVELLNRDDIKFNNITVTFDGLNYYATFNIEGDIAPDHLPLTGKQIGCDINSNTNGWLVTSEGQKEFFNIDHDIQMIKHVNRLMDKCREKSKKWKELHQRLIKWYNTRTNKLNDYIERLSYNLVKEYDVIVFEKTYATIKILIGGEQNMVFPLSRFIKRLEDKFKLYKPTADGVQFVDPKNTSKTCNRCGYVNEELDVKTRNWECPDCGEILDRDVNAAINILNRWFNGDCPEKT